MIYQFLRLFYSFGLSTVNPNPDAMAEPTPTRCGSADQETPSCRYPKDAGPASAPPVSTGPPRLPSYQLVPMCILDCYGGASGASVTSARPAASFASSWRFVHRRCSLCAFSSPNASPRSPRKLSETWSTWPSASKRSRGDAFLGHCCWPAASPDPRRRSIRDRGFRRVFACPEGSP